MIKLTPHIHKRWVRYFTGETFEWLQLESNCYCELKEDHEDPKPDDLTKTPENPTV